MYKLPYQHYSVYTRTDYVHVNDYMSKKKKEEYMILAGQDEN